MYSMRNGAQGWPIGRQRHATSARLHSPVLHVLSKMAAQRRKKAPPIEAVATAPGLAMAVCEQMLSMARFSSFHALANRQPGRFHLAAPCISSSAMKSGQRTCSSLLRGASANFGRLRSRIAYSGLYPEIRAWAHRCASIAGKERLYPQLKALFSSHLAALLMSMALENKVLPATRQPDLEQEVARGRLVRSAR